MKTVNELISKMLEIFPDAVIEEDADYQIVVYTGLMADKKDNLVPMPEEESDED